MKRIVAIAGLAMGVMGCSHTEPPASVSAAPTTQEVPGVVATKPFIAWPQLFTPRGSSTGGTPSILLQLHARSDSPVALAEYGKQKVYPLAAFELRSDLSADEVQRRLGPPAQLANYSDEWFVYRLTHGKELWLHFSKPDQSRLTAADIVRPQEDGYTRDRVFSAE
jgi:hypothetical protein